MEYTEAQKQWVKEFKSRIGVDPSMDRFEMGLESFEASAKKNTTMVIDDARYLEQLAGEEENT